jgi:hypothetical protein
MLLTSQGKAWWRRVFGGWKGRRMTVDNEDTERQHRDPDIAGEERQTLARHRLAQKLGIEPRLAEYLLELRKRIEKLEDRQGSS